MKLEPVGHRILVKLKNVEEKSSGGIILPSKSVEAEKYAMQEATVEAMGSQAYKAFDDGKPWVKVGDRVLIAKYCGEDRKDEETGEIFRILNDEDVFAKVQE